MKVADIQVYQCDGYRCFKTFAVKDDETLQVYCNTWAESLSGDYCPACQQLPIIIDQLAIDARVSAETIVQNFGTGQPANLEKETEN